MIVEKKVRLSLVGLDGNALSLLGAFGNAARRQGWSKAEIEAVQKEAMAGDYNSLLCVLMEHCEDEEEPEDDDEELDEQDDIDDEEEEDEDDDDCDDDEDE